MLIDLRNALMSGKRLPYDAEVEYLESTGTQFVDTGVKGAEQNLVITAEVRINIFNAYTGAFGNYASEPMNCYRLILTNANNGQAYSNCGYIASSSHIIRNFTMNAWHTVVLNGAEDRCFCDGVEFTKPTRFVQGTANANTIKLFTSGAVASGTWSKQISAFKVELNDVLVRDFIPVRFTNEQGISEGAMFDRANPTVGMNPDGSARTDGLYRNRGTGAFGYGNDLRYPTPKE